MWSGQKLWLTLRRPQNLIPVSTDQVQVTPVLTPQHGVYYQQTGPSLLAPPFRQRRPVSKAKRQRLCCTLGVLGVTLVFLLILSLLLTFLLSRTQVITLGLVIQISTFEFPFVDDLAFNDPILFYQYEDLYCNTLETIVTVTSDTTGASFESCRLRQISRYSQNKKRRKKRQATGRFGSTFSLSLTLETTEEAENGVIESVLAIISRSIQDGSVRGRRLPAVANIELVNFPGFENPIYLNTVEVFLFPFLYAPYIPFVPNLRESDPERFMQIQTDFCRDSGIVISDSSVPQASLSNCSITDITPLDSQARRKKRQTDGSVIHFVIVIVLPASLAESSPTIITLRLTQALEQNIIDGTTVFVSFENGTLIFTDTNQLPTTTTTTTSSTNTPIPTSPLSTTSSNTSPLGTTTSPSGTTSTDGTNTTSSSSGPESPDPPTSPRPTTLPPPDTDSPFPTTSTSRSTLRTTTTPFTGTFPPFFTSTPRPTTSPFTDTFPPFFTTTPRRTTSPFTGTFPPFFTSTTFAPPTSGTTQLPGLVQINARTTTYTATVSQMFTYDNTGDSEDLRRQALLDATTGPNSIIVIILNLCDEEDICLEQERGLLNLNDSASNDQSAIFYVTAVITLTVATDSSSTAVVLLSTRAIGTVDEVQSTTIRVVQESQLTNCSFFNGGCYYECVQPSDANENRTCRCPDNTVLSSNGRDCLEWTSAVECLFRYLLYYIPENYCLFMGISNDTWVLDYFFGEPRVTTYYYQQVGLFPVPDAVAESTLYMPVTLTRSGCLRIFYLLNSSVSADNYLTVVDTATGNVLWSATPSVDGRWQWGLIELSPLTDGFTIKARSNAPGTVGIAAIKATYGTCQKVRLVDGSGSKDGFLEYQTDEGVWIPVCSAQRARFPQVCQNLGFASDTVTYLESRNVPSTSNSSGYVTTVLCTEYSQLDECSMAFVFDSCNIYTNTTPCSEGQTALRCDAPVRRERAIRLVGGYDYFNGRVEVHSRGRFSAICYEEFRRQEFSLSANLLCRSLGLSGGSFAPHYFFPGYDRFLIDQYTVRKVHYWEDRYPIPVAFRSLTCSCEASELAECQFEPIGNYSCEPYLGLFCQPPQAPRLGGIDVENIRLVGGRNEREGRLELKREGSNEWGTVCISCQQPCDATVAARVCKTMGFEALGACLISQWAFQSAPESQQIWLRDIDCSDTVEGDTLEDCRSTLLNAFEPMGCDHTKDIAIVCGDTTTQMAILGVLELKPFPLGVNEGILEVSRRDLFDGSSTEFGTVCDDHLGLAEADVVCIQQGYMGGGQFASYGRLGTVSSDFVLDDVQARSGATYLSQCTGRKWGEHNCNRREQVGIRCSEMIGVRLTSERLGLVQLRFGGVWGVIPRCRSENCYSYSVDNTTAMALCRLALPGIEITEAIASFENTGNFGYDPSLRFGIVSNPVCPEDPTTFRDCTHNGWGNVDSYISSALHLICFDNTVGLTAVPFNESLNYGVVQATYRGVTVSVCANEWTREESNVLCRELNYTAGQLFPSSTFDESRPRRNVGIISINCSGTEGSLSDCDSTLYPSSDYYCFDQAAVICRNTEEPIVTLECPSTYDGRVNVTVDGVEGYLGTSYYGSTAANITNTLCQVCGYDRGYVGISYYRSGYALVDIMRVSCAEGATDIQNCTANFSPNVTRPLYYGAVLRCFNITSTISTLKTTSENFFTFERTTPDNFFNLTTPTIPRIFPFQETTTSNGGIPTKPGQIDEVSTKPQPQGNHLTFDVNCDFENTLCGYTNWRNYETTAERPSNFSFLSNSDHLDWQYAYGSNSDGTGPSRAISGSRCALMDASTPEPRGSFAVLESPYFDLFPGQTVCFYYHLYGDGNGILKVLLLDFRDIQMGIFEAMGDQGNTWNIGKITAEEGCFECKLLIIGFKGDNFRSDVAVDRVSTNCSPNDTVVSCGGQNSQVSSNLAFCNDRAECLDENGVFIDEINCPITDRYYGRCGDGRPYPFYTRCDGFQYCRNYADEACCGNTTDCQECNATTEYRCDSGYCIPGNATCDGYNDCGDLSDEKDCEDCLTGQRRCDGRRDCFRGRDEQSCSVNCTFPAGCDTCGWSPNNTWVRAYADTLQKVNESCNDIAQDVNLVMVTETDNAELYLDYVQLGYVRMPRCVSFRYYISEPENATLSVDFGRRYYYFIEPFFVSRKSIPPSVWLTGLFEIPPNTFVGDGRLRFFTNITKNGTIVAVDDAELYNLTCYEIAQEINCAFDGDTSCFGLQPRNLVETTEGANTYLLGQDGNGSLTFSYPPRPTCFCFDYRKTLASGELVIGESFYSDVLSVRIVTETSASFQTVCKTLGTSFVEDNLPDGVSGVATLAVNPANGSSIAIDNISVVPGMCSGSTTGTGNTRMCMCIEQEIASSKWCDGYPDCFDGSDEWDCTGGYCHFQPGSSCIATQEPGFPLQWLLNTGSTPTPFTGPYRAPEYAIPEDLSRYIPVRLQCSGACTAPTPQYYLYMEATNATANAIAVLRIAGSGLDSCLRFHYAMIGRDVGSLQVVLDGSIPVWSLFGYQSMEWNFAQINIPSSATLIQIIARNGGTENANRADIAIDQITLLNRICPDLSAVGCQGSDYQCNDGRCIRQVQICDGVVNCQDGADEMACSNSTQEECPLAGVFQCRSGNCIPYSSVCNGYSNCGTFDNSDEEDCASDITNCQYEIFRCNRTEEYPNGADEAECTDEYDPSAGRPCPDNFFTTATGNCIPMSQRCDGKPDSIDASDEMDCPCDMSNEFRCGRCCLSQFYACNGIKDCPGTEDEQPGCEFQGYVCEDGRQAIPSEKFCDRSYGDCSDGSDEPRYCTCVPGIHWSCNGRCYPESIRCDGVNDCYDRSDELNCTVADTQVCTPCETGDECYPRDYLCDYRPDCMDGSDERPSQTCSMCLDSQFRCNFGKCIPRDQLNDGTRDCITGEDECGGRVSLCPGNSKPCEVSNRCLSENSYANGYTSCPNGDDEAYHPCCTGFVCRTSRVCIRSYWRCDGDRDCQDGSDEENCNGQACEPFQFACFGGDPPCISEEQRCDRFMDCLDGSDEPPGCEYELPSEDSCNGLKLYQRCNGQVDCEGGADETNCITIESGTTVTITGLNLPVCFDGWTDSWANYVCAELGLGQPLVSSSGDGTGIPMYVNVDGLRPFVYFYWETTTSCSSGPVYLVCGAPDDCGLRERTFPIATNQIIGGVVVPTEQSPWSVAIFFKGTFVCTGSIIDTCWVVTAAHCLDQESATPNARHFQVVIGANRADLRNETVFEAAMVIRHPESVPYLAGGPNDIGLIKVAPCIPLTGSARRVCLPEEGAYSRGDYCLSAGFGDTSDEGAWTYNLQIIRSTIVPIYECEQIYRTRYNSSLLICIGDDDYYKSVCSGDSGGGTVCTRRASAEGERYYLAGITSFGLSRTCGYRSGHTRVSAYVSWIRSTMQANP